MREMRSLPQLRLLFAAMLLAVLHVAPDKAHAAPRVYRIDAERSPVFFTWMFGRDEIVGRMPIADADIVIDFASLERSAVRVVADAARAEAGFPFATQAMKGPRMLDAARHPNITFASRKVERETPTSAWIEGALTIRGVTRPVRFHAQIYRQKGTDAGDLDHLTVIVTGTINRHDFGASGWPRDVAPEVGFKVVARMDAET